MTNKITHNGKQYDKGALYYDQSGKLCYAHDVDGNGNLKVRDVHTNLVFDAAYLIVFDQPVGAITDAPIELEEGCWYMTHANKPVYWDGQHWNITATGGNSGRYDTNRFTPLYKMERAK